ncbi:hypothetical protein C7K70_15295 [Aeromonas hydrophila]|nr:hypothetical protein C7K70_15295 [Aeromonas hydrophila]
MQSMSCEIQQFHRAPKCACIFLAISLYHVNCKSVIKIAFYGLFTLLAHGEIFILNRKAQKTIKPLT